MEVNIWAWLILGAVVFALITFDVIGHVRTPHAPTIKEAAWWSAGYVLLAVAFGFFTWWEFGAELAGQYFAGYLTEKALSVDNLFVFVLIISAFRVPRQYQQKALMFGIVIALVLRLLFILLGAAIIERFSAIFYLFGAWLIWTAVAQAKAGVGDQEESEEYKENRFTALVRRALPVTDGFVGQRFLARQGGKTYLTPMLLCVIALGTADLMFAFDSIPAIFGLTQEPYIVFAANAMALLGLRQLYFLIDGLLSKLIYLHYGLAIILGFIGVKLILHALHENNLPFINGGDHVPVPDIGIAVSLGVIGSVIAITVVASLVGSRLRASKSDR